MDIREIENIYKLIVDPSEKEQDKIDGIKATYSLTSLYNEALDANLYTEPETQFYLNVIKHQLDLWEERNLIDFDEEPKVAVK